MQEIPQDLIIRALELTGKTILSVSDIDLNECELDWKPMSYFSMKSFLLYCLSPDFIDKYAEVNESISYWTDRDDIAIDLIWRAINQFQKWNPKPIIDLLSKI